MEAGRKLRCSCAAGDLFADLPLELRPRPQKRSSLREVTCPSCGKVYWTNRDTDLCFDCEKRAQAGGVS
jgi:uncharacterized protein with PIN domain